MYDDIELIKGKIVDSQITLIENLPYHFIQQLFNTQNNETLSGLIWDVHLKTEVPTYGEETISNKSTIITHPV